MSLNKIASFYALATVLVAATLLSGTAQAQQTTSVNDDDCPVQPDCCEDDCCGPGTIWTGERCEFSEGSPGWEGPGSNTVEYEVGCVARHCCNEDCCDTRFGTEFNATFQPLGRCTPTCQNWTEQVPTKSSPIEQAILASPPGEICTQPCARLQLALPTACSSRFGVVKNFDYNGNGVNESWATAPLIDAAGTVVQVACLDLREGTTPGYAYTYHLLVNGASVGMCPWIGGRNSGWVYAVDNDGDGFVDRHPNGTIVEFLKTLWISADGPLPGEPKFSMYDQQQGQTMEQEQQNGQTLSPKTDDDGNIMRWLNSDYIWMLDDDQDGLIAITTYVYNFMDSNATKFLHDVELDGSNRVQKVSKPGGVLYDPVVFVPGLPEDTPGSPMAPFRRNLQANRGEGADIYAMTAFQNLETEVIVHQGCPQPNVTTDP